MLILEGHEKLPAALLKHYETVCDVLLYCSNQHKTCNNQMQYRGGAVHIRSNQLSITGDKIVILLRIIHR
jgi:hypothetical protein